MKMNHYHFGKGTIEINGSVIGDVEATFTPARMPPRHDEKTIRFGPIELTTRIAATDLDMPLFGPVPAGPPTFSLTPGDTKPGKTIVGRVACDESAEDGHRIGFESHLRDVMYTENPGTGEPLFYAVADGGYEFPISREAFIELVIQMSNGVDPKGFRTELDKMIPRSKV